MVKCRRFKKVRKRVCADFVGGAKRKRGQPGKKCRRTKMATVKVCADFGKKGHGKLTRVQREAIRKKVRAGAFGGKGVMSSISSCKEQVKSQKARGMPYAMISKRLTLISTWNKRKNPILSSRARNCRNYAKELYGR